MHFKLLALSTLLTTAFAAPSELASRTSKWAVVDFKRDCTDPKTCTYHLDIYDGYWFEHCTVIDKGEPATTHPWFGKSCAEKNGFYLSWGWDYAKNFTVLTVDDQQNKIRAFFGYDHPNDGLPIVTYDNKESAPQHY